jgi:hypothetical protein
MRNSHGGGYEVYCILECCAVQSMENCQRFSKICFPVFRVEAYSSTVKVGVAVSSETSKIFYHKRQPHTPEQRNFNLVNT